MPLIGLRIVTRLLLGEKIITAQTDQFTVEVQHQLNQLIPRIEGALTQLVAE